VDIATDARVCESLKSQYQDHGAPLNPCFALLHSEGSKPTDSCNEDGLFRTPRGCKPCPWMKSPAYRPPSVVPATLSGPGRLVDGSHTNRYGRAVGRSPFASTEAVGDVGRERLEDISDIVYDRLSSRRSQGV